MRTNKAKRYDEQIEREIEKAVSRFSEHLMSNSKWVKLIGKLVDNYEKVKKVNFKKVQNDKIGELYLEEDTTFGFDYWQNGFEEHNSLGGILEFKEIEYLIFPGIVDNETGNKQDLDEIVDLITSVGQFALEIDADNVRLICYR